MDLTSLLSPEQHEAATYVEGPLCILAGAGSGKTRVITHRVAYLIGQQRVRPWQILAVTFTNKAAGEMRARVEALVPGAGRDVKVGTFHAMAARFLRQFGDAVEVSPRFVIYDMDDAQRLMKRVVVEEFNWSKDLVRPILRQVNDWQCEGLSPVQVPSTPWDAQFEKSREAYFRYADRMQAMGALDFGGLLVKLRDLLVSPAGAELTRRVRHLLVDEYQDVNRVQAEIVLALAKDAETIAVVGDDDQAIYGWRGASADNLKQFIDQVDGTHLVRLQDNYRSTASILEAANGVIEHNALRLGKELKPTHEDGQRIRVLRARDDIEEARRIVGLMQDELRVGTSPEELAVLYRTNAASRVFEDELRRAGIPYRLVGGVRFYDRKEVKDVLATLRAALNPRSDVDTLRMVGAVPRGIGDKSVARIQKAAADEGLSVLEAMAEPALLEGAGVSTRARKSAAALADRVLELGDRIRTSTGDDGEPVPAELNAKEAIAMATELSGVSDRLEAENTPDAEGRLENLGALLTAAAQHVEDARVRGLSGDVYSFLEDASLLSGDDRQPNDDEEGEKVTLMTLHGAKGLEYAVVFMVGLEEGTFPHAMATKDDSRPDGVEEERRLAYVGITRAKRRLTLSWARRRMVAGEIKPRQMSRFLEEIPTELLEGDIPWSTGRSRGTFPPAVRSSGQHVEYEPGEGPGAGRRAGGRRGLPTSLMGQGAEQEVSALARSFRAVKDRLKHSGGPAEPAAAGADSEPRVELDEGAAPEPAEPAGGPVSGGPEADGPEAGGLTVGGRVEHASFGAGSIVGFRGQGRMRSALVRFDDDARPRVIILRHLSPVPASDEVHVVLDEVPHD